MPVASANSFAKRKTSYKVNTKIKSQLNLDKSNIDNDKLQMRHFYAISAFLVLGLGLALGQFVYEIRKRDNDIK